jgi:hypothetical protein
MKQIAQILIAITLSFFVAPSLLAQQSSRSHSIFSAFTTAPNPGIIYEVQSITTYGACVTVQYNEIHVPGSHLAVLADYEEHLSIPVISETFEYMDAINQFGEHVDAVFTWQDRIFDSTPCPIVYVVAPPSFLLYEAPGARPMVNTSNRAEIAPGKPGIAGFVINEPTWVIIRGIGPSMNLDGGYIHDPVITLHADQYLLDDLNDDLENSISNDNWQDTVRKETLEYWDMVPENENESALVTYLYPGPYTVHLATKEESGSGLVEVYIAPYSLPLE